MTTEAKKTIGHYLLLRAVSASGISFTFATYVTFLISKGLNLLQVNLVNFVFFGMLFIFEIPTGVFADVFGRKLSFILSCLLSSLGLFIYAGATSFWWFALAEATAAVGSTFANGAFQAWLIDRLQGQHYEGPIEKIFSKEQQIKNGVAIVAAALGAFAADRNASLPFSLGGCVMLLAGILAILLMKEKRVAERRFSFDASINAMMRTVRVSTDYAAKNKAVRFIVIMGIVQYFSVQAPNMQWQPFFIKFLPGKSSLGFIFGGISIALIIGSAMAPRFLGKIKDEKIALAISQIIIGAGICLTTFCGVPGLALGIFLAHEIARGVFVPVKDAYLNDNIPSGERATLISFESFSHEIGGMIGLLVSGFVAQYASMRSAWVLSGIILIVSTLILLKDGRK